METCGMSAIKYLLFLFNFVFVLIGILIIVVASIDIVVLKKYSDLGDVAGLETDILLIVIGLLILVIAAFGCFGAIKESPKLLYLYAGSLILIIIFELSVGIAAAAMRPQMETTMKRHLRDSFIKNKAESDRGIFWDTLQSNRMCCGVIGPSDYNDLTNSVPLPPASCCPDAANVKDSTERAKKRDECVVNKSYYTTGCEDQILETIHMAGIGVIVTGIVFCFVEVLGIILAICLALAIKREMKTEAEA